MGGLRGVELITSPGRGKSDRPSTDVINFADGGNQVLFLPGVIEFVTTLYRSYPLETGKPGTDEDNSLRNQW